MNASAWAWLKARDEKRYRLAQAMRTYLNHLECSVREARETDFPESDRPWGGKSRLALLEADEAIVGARLGGL